MGRLFGTDGVRGIANRELTPELAFKLGKAGTAAFFTAIVLVCLRDVWLPLWTVGVAVMYVAVALAIIAMLGYARAYLIQGRNDRTQKPDEANK